MADEVPIYDAWHDEEDRDIFVGEPREPEPDDWVWGESGWDQAKSLGRNGSMGAEK